jgi:hypothetical protein
VTRYTSLQLSENHIDNQQSLRNSLINESSVEQLEVESVADRLFLAQKMRILFKNTHEDGLFSSFIATPLAFIRDFTIPIGDGDAWNRKRASVVPCTFVFAFFWLNGYFNEGEES